jgi:pimeloyl-ACP methyl ester carboxylesterase
MMSEEEVNGVKLKVSRLSGNADQPTIVFLHDSLGSITLWRDFPQKLGELTNCNVLVYDRQGYGESSPFSSVKRNNDYMEIEADVLHELITNLNLEQVILFGHSDGGTISLIAAAKYPDRIIGIITEGAHIFVEDITLKGIRDAVETYRNTNLKEKLQKYHGEKTDAVFKAWTETWLSQEYRTWNIEHFLPEIKCPVLVIQGENDEYGSLKQVDGIISQVKGEAKKLIIPGIGHSPHKETSEIVLKHSAAFIHKIIFRI